MGYINFNEQLLKRWDSKNCPQEYLDIATAKIHGCRLITFNLPTECHIVTPKVVFPVQGRMWETGKFVLRGNIVDYNILKKEPSFSGTSYYSKVYLTEILDDNGEEGHIDYCLYGYGLTSNPDKIKQYYCQNYV